MEAGMAVPSAKCPRERCCEEAQRLGRRGKAEGGGEMAESKPKKRRGRGPGGGGLPRQNARLREGFPRHYSAGRGAEEPLPENLEGADTAQFPRAAVAWAQQSGSVEVYISVNLC